MVFDVCVVCGRRHNPAHRCPVVRLNPTLWLHDPAGIVGRPVPVHELSEFDVECPYCSARFWRNENINCCGGGRLQLPLDHEVPDALAEIILSAHVRANIRRYWSVVFLSLAVCGVLRYCYHDVVRQVQHGFRYGFCGS
jgi:hypothetical protein